MSAYKYTVLLLVIAVGIGPVVATIDLNLQELEYVADHLTVQECRKLAAALLDPSFELDDNISAAERVIPADVSCLKLLLHWNSTPGQGKGSSHVTLVHRLKQLGHDSLAVWLSGTVFHQLEQDLNRTLLMNPFKQLAEDNETQDTAQETSPPTQWEHASDDDDDDDDDNWLPVDNVLLIILIFLVILTLAIPAPFVWRRHRRRIAKTKGFGIELDDDSDDDSNDELCQPPQPPHSPPSPPSPHSQQKWTNSSEVHTKM
jgi:hypothetical protein